MQDYMPFFDLMTYTTVQIHQALNKRKLKKISLSSNLVATFTQNKSKTISIRVQQVLIFGTLAVSLKHTEKALIGMVGPQLSWPEN